MDETQQEQLKKITAKGSMLENTGVLGMAKSFIEVEDKIDTVEASIAELIDEIKKKDTSLVYEVDEDKIAQNVLSKVVIPEPIKGEPGEKGDSYILTQNDKKEIASSIKVPIVEKVIEKTIVEQPVVTEVTNNVENPVTGEDIVYRVNDLPTDDEELKIDFIHIKNTENFVKSIKEKIVAGGTKFLSYLWGDVDINNPQNNEILKYDSSSGKWKNGTDTGNPADPNKSIQYNDNGAFAGTINHRWNKNSNQLAVGEVGEFEDDSTVPIVTTGNANTWNAIQTQNLSTGDNASADFFVAADNDSPTETGHFGDFGIWGSGFIPSNSGIIETIRVSSDGSFTGGSGYTVGDILTIQTGNADAEVQVATVDGSGKVLTADIILSGTGYDVGINNATTGGTGSGCYIDILSIFDLSGFQANDVYSYASGGNMILGTDSGAPGKNLKIFLGGFATGNKVIEVSQSQGTSGVIPELDADPGDPFEQSAWVLKSGGGVIPDGTPIGLLLGLTYTDVTPINTYQLSYFTKEGTIIRTTMS